MHGNKGTYEPGERYSYPYLSSNLPDHGLLHSKCPGPVYHMVRHLVSQSTHSIPLYTYH